MTAIKVCNLFRGACLEKLFFSAPFEEARRLGLNNSLHCPDKATCILRGDWEIVENNRNGLPACLSIVLYLNPDLIWMEQNLVMLISEGSKLLDELVYIKTSGGFNKSM